MAHNIIPKISVKSKGRIFPAGRAILCTDEQFNAWVDIYGRENFTEINKSPKELLAEKLEVLGVTKKKEEPESKIIIPPSKNSK